MIIPDIKFIRITSISFSTVDHRCLEFEPGRPLEVVSALGKGRTRALSPRDEVLPLWLWEGCQWTKAANRSAGLVHSKEGKCHRDDHNRWVWLKISYIFHQPLQHNSTWYAWSDWTSPQVRSKKYLIIPTMFCLPTVIDDSLFFSSFFSFFKYLFRCGEVQQNSGRIETPNNHCGRSCWSTGVTHCYIVNSRMPALDSDWRSSAAPSQPYSLRTRQGLQFGRVALRENGEEWNALWTVATTASHETWNFQNVGAYLLQPKTGKPQISAEFWEHYGCDS